MDKKYFIKFTNLVIKFANKNQIPIQGADLIVLKHLLRNKNIDYSIVKLIDKILLKYLDVFKRLNIKYKTLEMHETEVLKDKPASKKLYFHLRDNVIEISIPILPLFKERPLLKELEMLGFSLERKEINPVWFTVVRDPNIFEELEKINIIKDIGYEYNDVNRKNKMKLKLETDIKKQKKLFNLSSMTSINIKETIDFKDLYKKMYPFQRVSIEYSKHNKSILIADEMGLGKTLQGLAIVEYHQDFPAVIVVPSMLKENWKNEVNKWLPHRTVTIVKSNNPIPQTDIYIITYNLVVNYGIRLTVRKPKTLICDEAHFLKSEGAQRTKAVDMNFKSVPRKILMTGTPILNRTTELISQLKLLGILKSHFGGKTRFKNRYSIKEGFKYTSNNVEELQEELRKSCMLRRQKKVVLKELPPKTKQMIFIPLTDYNIYNEVQKDIIVWYKKKMKDEHDEHIADILAKIKKEEMSEFTEKLIKLEYLKQAAVELKLKYVFDWIDNTLEQTSKLVIFAYHRKIIEAIYDRYKTRSVMIYGGMQDQISIAVNEFQTDPKINIFIGSIKSAGVGINLTAADKLVFVEFVWTPAEHQQAEDRIHRIGQKEAVNIYYLIAKGTVEEYIYEMILSKEEMIEKSTNIEKIYKVINDE